MQYLQSSPIGSSQTDNQDLTTPPTEASSPSPSQLDLSVDGSSVTLSRTDASSCPHLETATIASSVSQVASGQYGPICPDKTGSAANASTKEAATSTRAEYLEKTQLSGLSREEKVATVDQPESIEEIEPVMYEGIGSEEGLHPWHPSRYERNVRKPVPKKHRKRCGKRPTVLSKEMGYGEVARRQN